MPFVEVCLSPALIGQYELKGKRVIVVDIFRATSCVVAGLHSGVAAIRPVESIEEAISWGEQGYIMAGERGGQKVKNSSEERW